jgi:hypothetical protein
LPVGPSGTRLRDVLPLNGSTGSAIVSDGMDTTQILLLALPILVVELALIVFALRDLLRPERRVRGDSKLMWGIIVVIFGILGPVLYFLVGREVE